jgi:hypothetical protein
MNNAAAGLSANAFDLAEWISLSPAMRVSNPPMLTPFLLRACLGLIAVLFMLNGRHAVGWLRWLNAALSLLLTITLLPPIEFIRAAGGTDDPNYRQLFGLFVGTLIVVVIVAVLPNPQRWWRWINLLVALLTIVCASWGIALALSFFTGDPLHISAPLGIGVIWMIVTMIAHQIAAWYAAKA